jgi:hypothetical protein
MVAAIGAKIYVAGGYTDSGFDAVARTYEFDTDTGVWTRRADMPTRRGAGAAVAYNGRLYVFGGERAGATVSESAVYDPQTDFWTPLTPMPTPRNHNGAAVVRGRMYVIGGRPGNLDVNEAYDPRTNTWTVKSPMPTGRSGLAAAAAGRFIHVFGGEGNAAVATGIFPQVEAYDADLDSWTALEPMPLPRHGIGAGVAGNRIFIPAGSPLEGFGTTAHSDFFAVHEELVLPHFVMGAGYHTEITISNPEPAREAEVTLLLTDQNGLPLDGALESTSFSLRPLSSRTLSSSSTGSAIRIGKVVARSDSRISAFATIRAPGLAPIAVYPAALSRNLVFPVRRSLSSAINTAFVVSNTSSRDFLVTISLLNAESQEVASLSQTIQPGQQLSRFLHEFFPAIGNEDFTGSVTVRAAGQLTVLALRFERDGIVTVPVMPIE